jgi:hypothetical protein
MFYERFSENLTLQALRFGGGEGSQLDLVVSANETNPAGFRLHSCFCNSRYSRSMELRTCRPLLRILAALPQSNSLRQVSPELKIP